MSKLIAILNCDSKFGIGKANGLLFRLPKDMAFFRKTTEGHAVAMGENTLLSFPGSAPLKNRKNIVLSKDASHAHEGVVNVHSLPEFLVAIKEELAHDDVFVIGGASIYRQMLPYYDEVLLTKVDEDGGAEVFFPNLDEDPNYECVEEKEPEEDNGHQIRFTRYVNRNKQEF